MRLSWAARVTAASAIEERCREMVRNGRQPPPGLAEFAQLLWPRVTPAADAEAGRKAHVRKLSAARSRRYRQRKRDELDERLPPVSA